MSTLPTSDLRSEAKPYQRDKNHTTKWARGGVVAPNKPCDHANPAWFSDSCEECKSKPAARDMSRRNGRHYNNHKMNAGQHAERYAVARKAFRNEVVEATDGPLALVAESSSDEEVIDASAAPEPDAEIMYSYDSRSGPTEGNDILSYAITKAVQRFENNETDKLVKKEYDLVLDGKDDTDAYAADADDDFELIGHSHLN